MPKGRKPYRIPPVEKKLSLPGEVVTQVELLLADPLTGRPRHGAWSRLCTKLLRAWLAEQRRPAKNNPPEGDQT